MITFTGLNPKQDITRHDASSLARILLDAARCPDPNFTAKISGGPNADGFASNYTVKKQPGAVLSEISLEGEWEGQKINVFGEAGDLGFYFTNRGGDVPVDLTGAFKQGKEGPVQEGGLINQGSGIQFVEGNVGRYRVEGKTTKRGSLIVDAS